MKREKRQTKKERKAQAPAQLQTRAGGQQAAGHQGHIHCIACGKHLDAGMFGEADGAEFLRCDHGSDFPACIGCRDKAKAMIAEHDRTNKPVQKVAAWH